MGHSDLERTIFGWNTMFSSHYHHQDLSNLMKMNKHCNVFLCTFKFSIAYGVWLNAWNSASSLFSDQTYSGKPSFFKQLHFFFSKQLQQKNKTETSGNFWKSRCRILSWILSLLLMLLSQVQKRTHCWS